MTAPETPPNEGEYALFPVLPPAEQRAILELSARLDAIADRLAEDGPIVRRLEHLDVQVHELQQFITEHAPLLDRAKAIMNPGAAAMAFLPGRHRGGKNTRISQ